MSADTYTDYGLVIFIVPEGYRLDDYRRAAGYLFVDDEEVRWSNPGRSRRVYQAPAIKPAKGIAQEISIFDLPDARFLVARGRADVPDEVLFAAAAVIDVTRPLPLHIIAVRRLLRLPALLPEVIEDLCHRSQEFVLATILRRECAASDLKASERQIPDGAGGRTLANLPGLDGVKAWAETVERDILLWRGGSLPWSEVTKGALLSGPPGTGKTLFAQAFADACGLKLVTASVGDWEEAGYLNHTLAAMRESFEAAIAANGAVLFIDEFDGLSRRDGLKGEYAHYRRIVINHFLQLSSGPMEGVILLGATNYPEAIDPAALRAGRMEKLLVLPLPDQQARSEILAFYLGQGFEPNMLMDIVANLEGQSGAQLELLAKEARARARGLGREVDLQDIQAILPRRKKFTTEERFRLAVHEAGHALAALSIKYAQNVTIAVKETYDPAKGANIGGSAKYDAVDESLQTEDSLMDRIAVALAGMAAEEVVFENRSIGSGGGLGTDVEMAASVARLMVGSYGLGRVPTYFRKAEDVSAQPLPGDLESEVSEILSAQYERVVAILEPEREGVVALAKQALLKESVTIGHGNGV